MDLFGLFYFMQEKEIWRDIKGYEGLYMVSSLGNIKSIDRWITYENGQKHFYKSQKIKPGLNRYGYRHITLCKGKVHKTKRVAFLVSSEFIPNPCNKPQINHIDGNKQNDAVSNLEWNTASENQLHRYHVLKKGLIYGEKNKSSKITDAQAEEIRVLYANGKQTYAKLGEIYGLSGSTVAEIVTYKIRKNKTT